MPYALRNAQYALLDSCSQRFLRSPSSSHRSWSPPAALASGDLVVYGDALAGSWDDWSWNSTRNFANTIPALGGCCDSIAVTLGPYGGLSLHAPSPVPDHPLQRRPLLYLRRQAGREPSASQLTFYTQSSDGGNCTSTLVDFTAPAGVWTPFTITMDRPRQPRRHRAHQHPGPHRQHAADVLCRRHPSARLARAPDGHHPDQCRRRRHAVRIVAPAGLESALVARPRNAGRWHVPRAHQRREHRRAAHTGWQLERRLRLAQLRARRRRVRQGPLRLDRLGSAPLRLYQHPARAARRGHVDGQHQHHV